MEAGGIVSATFLVAAGGIVLASFLVGAGGIKPASFSLGAGMMVLSTVLVVVLVPSSDPSSARSIKMLLTLLPTISVSIPDYLVGRVGGGIMLPFSGDGGGMGIRWLEGGTDGEMIQSQLT